MEVDPLPRDSSVDIWFVRWSAETIFLSSKLGTREAVSSKNSKANRIETGERSVALRHLVRPRRVSRKTDHRTCARRRARQQRALLGCWLIRRPQPPQGAVAERKPQ